MLTKSQQRIADEADAIVTAFCQAPKMFNRSRRMATRAVVTAVIDWGLVMAWGHGYYAKARHIGAGRYHITFVESWREVLP